MKLHKSVLLARVVDVVVEQFNQMVLEVDPVTELIMVLIGMREPSACLVITDC